MNSYGSYILRYLSNLHRLKFVTVWDLGKPMEMLSRQQQWNSCHWCIKTSLESMQRNHTCTLWDFTVQTLYFHFSLVELIITSKPRTEQHFLIPHLSAMLQYLSLLWWAAAPGTLLNWWWWARGQDGHELSQQVLQVCSKSSVHASGGFWPNSNLQRSGTASPTISISQKVDFYDWFYNFLIEFYRSHFVRCSCLAQGEVWKRQRLI